MYAREGLKWIVKKKHTFSWTPCSKPPPLAWQLWYKRHFLLLCFCLESPGLGIIYKRKKKLNKKLTTLLSTKKKRTRSRKHALVEESFHEKKLAEENTHSIKKTSTKKRTRSFSIKTYFWNMMSDIKQGLSYNLCKNFHIFSNLNQFTYAAKTVSYIPKIIEVNVQPI